jgi:hypothetical protein
MNRGVSSRNIPNHEAEHDGRQAEQQHEYENHPTTAVPKHFRRLHHHTTVTETVGHRGCADNMMSVVGGM